MTSIREKFKDATVIFLVVHYEFECVRLTLLNILSILEKRENTYLILIKLPKFMISSSTLTELNQTKWIELIYQ